jgi:pyruvate kinase
MRQTKIVATLGPASRRPDTVQALLDAGTEVVRLNFSHGTRDGHAEIVTTVRAAARRAGRVVAVMQDLPGPKIRTGRLADGRSVTLTRDQTIRIGTGDFVGDNDRLSVGYAGLAASVRAGDRLLLDDGRIELEVRRSDGTEVTAHVVAGGTLGEHKGITAPGVALPDSGLTLRDVEDLAFGLELGVDLVAVSFVQSATDLQRAREVARQAGRPDVSLIAKIERPQAVQQMDAILGASDGVMVARGDLGLELPLEQVPGLQKAITRAARARGVPVIVATQVLESMRTELRPTRAEVGDVATAVDQSVDAIMLAGETAIGDHPVRCVETLDTILREAETSSPAPVPPRTAMPSGHSHDRALCEAAVTLAARSGAEAIVAVTRGGRTARLLSRLRPGSTVYAAAPSEAVANALALSWGVRPIVVAPGENIDADRLAVERRLVVTGAVAAGAAVVFVRVSTQLSHVDANFLALRRVGDAASS